MCCTIIGARFRAASTPRRLDNRMNNPHLHFVCESSLSDFENEVRAWLMLGYDFNRGMVCGGDEIGLWMERGERLYEYELLADITPDMLSSRVNAMHEQGWDLYQAAVLWNGFYLQWMFRILPGQLYLAASENVSLEEFLDRR